MANSKAAQVLERVKNQGVIRSRDFQEEGIEREYLRRLEQQGLLMRSGRGIYTLTDAELTENHSLAEASKRVPHATVCLLSALRFHELTTQAPFEVWLAIDNKARTPKEDILPLRIVYMSGPSLSAGVEEHQIEGVPVRVYSPAKTVADCFKYRNKIGLDVAIEALRDCWKKRRSTADEIWHYAKICRVSNVMRPYLASVV
ncbi:MULTISPECIES: type IV toxin-antitoxin system AbiEi family antitoxin domain-containing protein [Aerosakkonema]|uniref:type IV toxin-antitoxin system AbiEi family antitoxin domain-containing protein n=1 Tax=Aerosakkonema TaxID=1246629 RepID=UPI0035B7BEE3